MVERLTPLGARAELERPEPALPASGPVPAPSPAPAPSNDDGRVSDRVEGRPSAAALAAKLEAFEDGQRAEAVSDAERMFTGQLRRRATAGGDGSSAVELRAALDQGEKKRAHRRVTPKSGSGRLYSGRRPSGTGVLMPHLGALVKGNQRTAMLGRRQTTVHRPRGLRSDASIVTT